MLNLKNIRKAVALIGVVGVFAGAAGSTFATETTWQQNHPRRVEVNQRLRNQDKRINHATKTGVIGQAKAARLHKEDHQIRREERAMASQNGGHITRQEQKTLNQQENRVSKKIG